MITRISDRSGTVCNCRSMLLFLRPSEGGEPGGPDNCKPGRSERTRMGAGVCISSRADRNTGITYLPASTVDDPG
ncbi:MAG: hypothetical protein WC455_10970 [Dehalococcoidia bacterium]